MGRKVVGQAGGVFGGLGLHAGERAFRLGFDRADGLAIEIEQIVGEPETRLHRKLADGDTATGGQVEVVALLHEPAGGCQVGIYRRRAFCSGVSGISNGSPSWRSSDFVGAFGRPVSSDPSCCSPARSSPLFRSAF